MIQSISKSFVGNSTGQIGSNLRGRILAVVVTADSNVSNNWDLTLAGGTTGIAIFTHANVPNNATTTYHPRALANKAADGAAATDWFAEIPVAKEPVNVMIANAGTTGIITVRVIYDSDE